MGECWERGTATFMILGDVCTRRCGFCNVQTGKPTWNDPLEPLRVAASVKKMGLRHAVITSVDRDDLPDYGAGAFVGVIRSIRNAAPDCVVEVLTPDFRGQEMPLAKVIHERPDVFNHNVETVPRLYPRARRGSEFDRSCRVLRTAKQIGGDAVVTKSGLMVGLGESFEESRLVFSPLLDRFYSGQDYRTRAVKVSDSGRIRNELQTLCSDALEPFGEDSIRVHFDLIGEAIMSPDKKRFIREVLHWYKRRHPVWFDWLEIAD